MYDVKLEVGQRWRAYDGSIGKIEAKHFGGRCWVIDEVTGLGWSVSASEKAVKGFYRLDLKELLEEVR